MFEKDGFLRGLLTQPTQFRLTEQNYSCTKAALRLKNGMLTFVKMKLAALAVHRVELAVGHHVGGDGEPVGHVEKANHIRQIKDLAIAQAGVAKRLSVGLVH